MVERLGEVEVTFPEAAGAQIALSGDWLLEQRPPSAAETLRQVASEPGTEWVAYDASALGEWDTGLITFLVALEGAAHERGIAIRRGGLPEGTRRLVDLAFAVEVREGARRDHRREPFLDRLGRGSLEAWEQTKTALAFYGQLVLSYGRFLRGKASYQRSDLIVTIQEAGAEALGIVSLVAFLVGVILGFIGSTEFEKLGAGIYTADLVGLGMTRVLGPIMTGVVMTGRTGAAFAAHIGTMKVTEEIDALRTVGLDVMDFLVLPRTLALVLMMPLLTLYASVLGILGGMLVCMATVQLTAQQYLNQTLNAVGLIDVLGGLFMAAVFGVLVAIAGCQRGMACGGSAQAVGKATTSAVVTGIVLIVVACALLTFVYTRLGI